MTLGVFMVILLIHLAAAISPGPAFVVSVRTAAAEGFRPAAGFALGVGLGSTAWALAALAGLGLLFEVAPALLTALKVAGGVFLVWIAIMTWRHADQPLAEPQVGSLPRGIGSAVRLGVLTQLANPKTAVFFGAVFIGLVPPDAPIWSLALLLLAIGIDETLWYVVVARVFSLARARAAYGRAKGWVDRAFGGLMAGLGVKIAAT